MTKSGLEKDGVRTIMYAFHSHDRKVVRQTVVAQMIAKRAFGFLDSGNDAPFDAEIGLGQDGQPARTPDHGDAMPAQYSGEQNLGDTLKQRHDGRQSHGQRIGVNRAAPLKI